MKTANLPRNGLSADYRATRRAAFAAGALSAALVSLATHALPIARAATEPPPAPLISPADCPACLDDPAA